MTTFHFGTDVNGVTFVEKTAVPVLAADGSTINVAPRPAAGAVLRVRDPQTHAELPSTLLNGNGYWSYTADIPKIEVSANDGGTWVPQYGLEAMDAAVVSGDVSQQALMNSLTAVQTANDAKAIAQAGGGGGGSSEERLYETAPGVYQTPLYTVHRIFIGQVRPTAVQGRRETDEWKNVVVVP